MIWNILYDYVLPTVLSIFSLMLVAVIPAAVQAYFKWLEGKGIKIDKDQQEIFQKGMETVAAATIAKARGGPLTASAIQAGVDYAKESLGGSIEKYKIDDDALARKVEAKATLLALQAPVAAPAVAVAEEIVPQIPLLSRRIAGRAPV